jgi:hypothetical protein
VSNHHLFEILIFHSDIFFNTTGAFIADPPYGLKVAPWDMEAWDKQKVTQVISQFRVLTSSDIWSVMMWCNRDDIKVYKEAFTDSGLINISVHVWYKKNHNIAGMTHCHLFAWECFVVGHFRPGGKVVGYYCDPNPLNRHDVIIMPGVTTRRRHPDKSIVNVTEKPAGIAK